jgi:cytochrome c5
MPALVADERRRVARRGGLARLVFAVGVLAATVACAAALRRPTAKDERLAADRWPGTTLADLERGRAVYVRRCSTCHTLHLPTAYSATAWPSLVETMSGKARLTTAEKYDVTRFVIAVARDREAPAESSGKRGSR